MKIYSNHLTEADVRNAFFMALVQNGADIYVEEIKSWTPRQYKVETPKHTNYAYGVEVWAESLYGKQATGHRPIGSYSLDDVPRAASWDDWGYVIAHLFNVDPAARIGFYDNEADFVAKVRKYPRKGSSLAFLDVLANIKEYDA